LRGFDTPWGAFDSAKNHKRQRRKRQSLTAKREKSQTPKFDSLIYGGGGTQVEHSSGEKICWRFDRK